MIPRCKATIISCLGRMLMQIMPRTTISIPLPNGVFLMHKLLEFKAGTIMSGLVKCKSIVAALYDPVISLGITTIL